MAAASDARSPGAAGRPSPTTRPPTGSPRRRSWRWCASTPPTSTTSLEPLPAAVRLRERLLDRPGALRAAHFPAGDEDDHEQARRRLAFEELLLDQLALQQRRRNRAASASAPQLAGPRELTARWLEHELPFPLTGDQRAALEAIDADIARGEPMQRLLMGEVGSGKTVVALYAMLRAVEHGFQAALMAPTETLAEQHFQTVQRLLGSESVTRRAADRLDAGSASHRPARQALDRRAVADRRHARADRGDGRVRSSGRGRDRRAAPLRRRPAGGARGGRARLGQSPHELHMTATPIPRTLALSHYGDLDMTVLRELPRGRQPIATHVCSSEAERERAYARIREEVDAGRQAFVVCPLVEESEALQARAATSEYERLEGRAVRRLRGRADARPDAAGREAGGDGGVRLREWRRSWSRRP